MHAKRSRGWCWYVCCVVHVLGIRPREASSSPSLVSSPNFRLAPYQFLFIKESCNNSGQYNSRPTGEKSSTVARKTEAWEDVRRECGFRAHGSHCERVLGPWKAKRASQLS